MDDEKKKMKWWERTALSRTKGKTGSPAENNVVSHDDENKQAPGHFEDDEPEQLATPGAVAVHGPGYRGDGDGDGDDIDGDVREGGGHHGRDGGADDEEATEAPLQVDSYAVKDGPTDEEIRQQILASTAHAEAVTTMDEPKKRLDRSSVLLLVVGAVIVVAVVVGVAVPLATRSQESNSSAQWPEEDVVASLTYIEYQGSGGLAMAIRAKTRSSSALGGELVTSGSLELLSCDPIACLESDESCVLDEYYYPGCCAGADCPNDTKCGEYCPMPPESCYLTDPSNKTCMRSDCYTCIQYDGKDVYNLHDYVVQIDCLEVGTAIRHENGQLYEWAIFCGPVVLGPVVEENRDLGEYQCAALRLGGNFSDDFGGLYTGDFPCQYIALAECGCGPSDMYTFGLPDPTGPCLPEGNCPFLCEDAGPTYARNLCRSFPENISWFEGKNAFNSSFFQEDVLAPENESDIYIKGLES